MHSVTSGGVAIPALGFGTFLLAGDTCVGMVSEALKMGYRHVDTAHRYGNEVEVGQGVRASGLARSDLFVTTKVWHDVLTMDGIERSTTESLERLGLDQVDLLLLHWPSTTGVPLKQTMAALCAMKQRGLTRAIGVANFPSALLDEACTLSDEPIATNQVEYHPFLSQRSVLAAAHRNKVSLTAYSPLAQGAITRDATVQAIAKAHGKDPGQIALRWLIQQPGVIAIPKTAHVERARSNLDIFNFSLTQAEMDRLSNLIQPNSRTVNPAFGPAWDQD